MRIPQEGDKWSFLQAICYYFVRAFFAHVVAYLLAPGMCVKGGHEGEGAGPDMKYKFGLDFVSPPPPPS